MKPLAKISISITSAIAIIGLIVTVIGFVGLVILPTTIVSVDTSYNSFSPVFTMDSEKIYVFNLVGIGHADGYSSGWVILYSGSEEIYEFYVYYSFDGDADFSSSPIGFYTPPKTADNYFFTYEAEYDVVYGSVSLKLQESLLQSALNINDFWILTLGPFFIVAGAISAMMIRRMSRKERHTGIIDEDREEIGRQEELESTYRMFPCPSCGLRTDGNFCEECGTELREEFIEFS